jgi:hypothetical protein
VKRLADIISYVFHPLWMPLAGMAFYLRYMMFVKVNPALPMFVLVVMFACTILFPLITIYVMRSSKMISSVHMPTRQERRWPLLFGTFYFFLAYIVISEVTEKFAAVDGLRHIAMAGIATLMICTLVNYFYKLSIHMAGIGGVTGMLLAYAPQAQINMLYILVFMVFASGLVGFARLKLSAHSSGQVAAGFAAGFISQFLLLSFFSTGSLVRI